MPSDTNEFGQPIGPAVPGWTPPPSPPREEMEGRYCRLEPLDPQRHAAELWEAIQADPDGRSWTYLPYGPFPDFDAYRCWAEQAAAGSDPLFFAIRATTAGREHGVPAVRVAPGSNPIRQRPRTRPSRIGLRGPDRPDTGPTSSSSSSSSSERSEVRIEAGTTETPWGRACGVASYLRITPPAGSVEVGHIHYAPDLRRTPAATEAMYLMMQRAFDLGYRRYEWKCDALNAASRAAAQRLGFAFEGIFRQATVYKGRNRDTAWYAVLDRDWPAVRAAFQAWLDPANFDPSGRQRRRLQDVMPSHRLREE